MKQRPSYAQGTGDLSDDLTIMPETPTYSILGSKAGAKINFLDPPATGTFIKSLMKYLRRLFMSLLTLAFLATSTIAHVGTDSAVGVEFSMAHDAGSHHEHQSPAVHDGSTHTGEHDDKMGHGDGHCCTLGGCGFVVATTGIQFNERYSMIQFDASARSGGSILSAPDFPPPRELT